MTSRGGAGRMVTLRRGRLGGLRRRPIGRAFNGTMLVETSVRGCPLAGIATVMVRSRVGRKAAEKVLRPGASQTRATGRSERCSTMGFPSTLRPSIWHRVPGGSLRNFITTRADEETAGCIPEAGLEGAASGSVAGIEAGARAGGDCLSSREGHPAVQ